MYPILKTDSCLNDLLHRPCDNSPFVLTAVRLTDAYITDAQLFPTLRFIACDAHQFI